MSLGVGEGDEVAKVQRKVHFSRAISVDTLQPFNLDTEGLWNLVGTLTVEEAIFKLPFDRAVYVRQGPRTKAAFYLAVHRLSHDDRHRQPPADRGFG